MNLSAFFLLFMCLSSPAAVATRRTSPPQCWHVIVRIPCWNVLISLPACFQNIVLLRKFRGLLFLMIIWAWTCKHWIENDSQGFRHHQSASSCSSVCPPALSFFFLRDDIFLKFPLSQSNCYLDLSALASSFCGTAACPEASISLTTFRSPWVCQNYRNHRIETSRSLGILSTHTLLLGVPNDQTQIQLFFTSCALRFKKNNSFSC